MEWPFLSSDKATTMMAAGGGGILSMLAQPALNMHLAILIFAGGELIALAFANPFAPHVAALLNIDRDSALVILAGSIGFFGVYILNACVVLGKMFATDPLALTNRIRSAWSAFWRTDNGRDSGS